MNYVNMHELYELYELKLVCLKWLWHGTVSWWCVGMGIGCL